MRTIGWLLILFGVWLVRAGLRGQIMDEAGNFILPTVIEETLVAIITGDDAKLKELDAQTSSTGLLSPSPENQPVQLLAGSSAFASDAQGNSTPGATGRRAAVISAAQGLRNDKYSQTRRWQNGFSDCSSFVGKALKKAGIKPPGSSQVHSYRLSSDWQTIPASQVQPGDIALNISHMVLCLGGGRMIGQQNSRRNVQESSNVHDLFAGTVGRVIYKTYKGYANVSGPKSGGGGGGGGSSSF